MGCGTSSPFPRCKSRWNNSPREVVLDRPAALGTRQDVHTKPCDRRADSDQLNRAPVEI